MTPALRGETQPPAWLIKALAAPSAICLGLFAGSVLAWFVGLAFG